MSSRKLFLGGLTKSTTTEQLFEVFSRYGLVVDAVVMERNGVPRGFGFVTFKDESSLGLVLADRVKVDGREVDIKRAVPEEEMEFAPTKVFVGGLSQSVDRAALKQHFEKYGDVRDAVVMMDRTTGRSRGFGFVRFAAPDAVEACLAHPQLLDGQQVDVKRAQPADALPPPKYPRSRDDKPKPQPRGRRQHEAPVADLGGFEMPQMDMMTANWMASLLSMQQLSQGQLPAFPFGYPGFGAPGFGAEAFPGFDPLALHLHAAQLPTPELPLGKKLQVETEIKVDGPMEASPLGDLSNVLATALDGKSPQRTRASPQHQQGSPDRRHGLENAVGENAPFTSDMKTAMKEAGIASIMNSVFPTA